MAESMEQILFNLIACHSIQGEGFPLQTICAPFQVTASPSCSSESEKKTRRPYSARTHCLTIKVCICTVKNRIQQDANALEIGFWENISASGALTFAPSLSSLPASEELDKYCSLTSKRNMCLSQFKDNFCL